MLPIDQGVNSNKFVIMGYEIVKPGGARMIDVEALMCQIYVITEHNGLKCSLAFAHRTSLCVVPWLMHQNAAFSRG